MPMPKPVCRTNLYNKIVQLEVCRTFSGRGMGINGTAQSYQVPGAAPRGRLGPLEAALPPLPAVPPQTKTIKARAAKQTKQKHDTSVCIIYIYIYIEEGIYIYIYINK